MQEIAESEYKQADEFRAKIADSMQWLSFETKLLKLIDSQLKPVLEASTEDRCGHIELCYKCNDLDSRTVLLEQATFRTDTHKNPTYLQLIEQRQD